MYSNNKCEIYANGTATIGDTNPSIPVIKLKNIVSGINGKIRTFAGKETIENIPVA